MSLVATVGASNANSYVTVNEADAYFADRLYASAWTGASSGDRAKALVTAARRLDQEEFAGLKVTTTQGMKWPRYDAYDQDGNWYPTDAIPQAVKDGQCELALELLKGDLLAESETKNLTSLKAGPVELQFKDQQTSGALTAQVRRLLNHLLATQSGMVRMVRG
jgi:hypothetical protein